MLTTFYIYRHIRPDTNQVFYIGKGKNVGNRLFERSRSALRRNRYWQNVVAKNGGKYEIEILLEFDNELDCDAKEKELIALYGRSDLGKGTLTNLTDGGDGSTNIIATDATRAKLRAALSGSKHPNWGKKLSAETCRKKSEALMGEKHHLYGKNLTEEWKDNIRKSKVGKDNPMYGKTGALSHRSKKVLNTKTGEVYASTAIAAEAAGMKVGRLYSILDGHIKVNRTDLVRI